MALDAPFAEQLVGECARLLSKLLLDEGGLLGYPEVASGTPLYPCLSRSRMSACGHSQWGRGVGAVDVEGERE